MSELLQKITEHYLSSFNYNGLPISLIKDYEIKEVQNLIEEGLIEALFKDINPYIKRFNQTASIEDQIRVLYDKYREVCLYPTPKALELVEKDETSPYTKLLQSGWGQYEIVYFEVEVLEQFFNDPRYEIIDYGYRGSVSYNSEVVDGDYIKNYGMAYPKGFKDGDSVDRAIAVFVHDLANLSKKAQMKWKSREIDIQDGWSVSGGFVKNLIYGEWVDSIWVYSALLKEQELINKMCDAVGINHIFLYTWDDNNYGSIPNGYRTILFPTRNNYYDFVNVLEKMTCENISIKALTQPQKNSKAVVHEKNEGSIKVLEKWLKKNGRDPKTVDDYVISPLKRVRKIRQTPAHIIVDDKYDKTVYSDQNELIKDVYLAVHSLRIMLGTHPLAKDILVPDELNNLGKIVIY